MHGLLGDSRLSSGGRTARVAPFNDDSEYKPYEHSTGIPMLRLAAWVCCLLALLLLFGSGIHNANKRIMLSDKPQVFSSVQKKRLLDAPEWAGSSSSPSPSARGERRRLVFVVMDGVGMKMFRTLPELESVLSLQELQEDGIVVEMRAQLPTKTYANLHTLTSGLVPQFSGVLGNKNEEPSLFDSVVLGKSTVGPILRDFDTFLDRLASCVAYVDPAAGSSAASAVAVYSDRPEQDYYEVAEWTDWTLRNFDKKSSDPYSASEVEAEPVKLATKVLAASSLHDVTVLYYNDVDWSGHNDVEHGQRFPESRLFRESTSRLGTVLRELILNLPSDALLVAAADHGQLDTGSHGGAERNIERVPAILYRRGSGAGTKKPQDLGVPPTPVRSLEGGGGAVPSNVDFGATVSVLMGCDVPRHSIGLLLHDALVHLPSQLTSAPAVAEVYAQLLWSQTQWCSEYLNSATANLASGHENLSPLRKAVKRAQLVLSNWALSSSAGDTSDKDVNAVIKALHELHAALKSVHQDEVASLVLVKTVSLLMTTVIGVLLTIVMRRTTWTDQALRVYSFRAYAATGFCVTITYLSTQLLFFWLFFIATDVYRVDDGPFVWNYSQYHYYGSRHLFKIGLGMACFLFLLAVAVVASSRTHLYFANKLQGPRRIVVRILMLSSCVCLFSVLLSLCFLGLASSRHVLLHEFIFASPVIERSTWIAQFYGAHLLRFMLPMFLVSVAATVGSMVWTLCRPPRVVHPHDPTLLFPVASCCRSPHQGYVSLELEDMSV